VAVLKDQVITPPTTPQQWRAISDEFYQKWNVPHACGAIDGKHIRIRKPPRSGSTYHNYKGYFSIVLMALVDAQYRFIWVDTGGEGSMSDAQIYNSSELCELLSAGTIGLPPAVPLPRSTDNKKVPYFLLGDDAFALRPYLMKPYGTRWLTVEERIANYRISRGRRVVENAFGILAQRFQLLLSTILQKPDTVRDIINAMVCIHNLLRLRNPVMNVTMVDHEDEHHNLVGGEWRNGAGLAGLNQAAVGNNTGTNSAKDQRDYLKTYFNGPGAVNWQNGMI